MLGKIIKSSFILLVFLLIKPIFAETQQPGSLFHIQGSGDLGGSVDVTLCLNARAVFWCGLF